MFRVGGLYDPSQAAIVLPREARRLARYGRAVAASARRCRNRGLQVGLAMMGQSMTVVARAIYGPYAWLVLAAAVIPTLILLLLVPSLDGRRRVARCSARVFFRLIGSPVRVEGAHRLPDVPCVVVANHASYLDGIILTAALPPNFAYLIKYEAAAFPLAGFLLKRIGSAFVNREDSKHRLRTARKLLKAAMRGESLAFFPEGTFDRNLGLKPFLPGAFGAAWRAKLPVVPIVIRGSRRKLPAQVWLCAPGPLSIGICEPIQSDALPSAAELASATRRRMLEHLGEPDPAEAEVE